MMNFEFLLMGVALGLCMAALVLLKRGIDELGETERLFERANRLVEDLEKQKLNGGKR